MTYKKYQSANNAICELEVAISNTDMSLKATGPYNRFKTENFIIKVTERDVDGKIIARENMYVVSRTGDTFTIGERAYEAVPIDDDATTNTKTALEFNAGAVVEMVISEEVIKDIQEEIERLEDDKADDDEVVHLTGNETIAGEKTFLVAPKAPTPTEDDDLTNKEYVDDNILDAGSPSALYEKGLIAGEDIDTNESVFLEDMVTFASADQVQAIGNTSANTRVSIPAFGGGVASNTLKLSLRKYVSPGVDLGVRIETDNAGEPSGTLFDPDATATVTKASLTTSLVDTTVTLADTITIPEGERVHIVLFAGTYGSETINGTNYFGVGYRAIDTTTRRAKTYDGADWSAGQATRFYYATSNLFAPKLLSLTDATYSYKLPTDLPRILTESKLAGEYAIATTLGLNDNFSGLTPLADYYLSDTPGQISSTPGTNEYWVGRSISNTILNVGGEVPPKFNTSFTSINVSVGSGGNETTSAYRPIRDEFVTVTLQASSTGSNVRLETSSDGSSWVTLYEAPTGSSHNRNILLKKGIYYRSHAQAPSPGSGSITVLGNASISIGPNQYSL